MTSFLKSSQKPLPVEQQVIYIALLALISLFFLSGHVIAAPDESFQHPVKTIHTPQNCFVGGNCLGDTTNLHVGRDYMRRGDGLAYSVAYGKLRNRVNYNDNVGCNSLSCNMGNLVVVEHLLMTGDKWLSLHAHLNSFGKNISQISGTPVVSNQVIGEIGCSGVATDTFCAAKYGGIANKHNHFELKNLSKLDSTNIETPESIKRSLWPYGYMTQSEANQLRSINGDQNPADIMAGVNLIFSDVASFQVESTKVLLPYFSRSVVSPNKDSYDVYGVVNAKQPLYGSLALNPTTNKTFNQVGVGGVVYGTETTDNLFIKASAELSSTSAALTGEKIFTEVGDKSFYAYSDAASGGFGRGYEIKFSILPENSEIVDNDGRLSKLDGDQGVVSKQGYFTAFQNDKYADGSLDVPGYYLSAKLFKGGKSGDSPNWARWFPSNNGTYEISVHVPKGATATNVKYKIYTKGKPADGTCSASNKDYPCFISDTVNQSKNQDKWVKLISGKTTRFDIATSATNGAYVGLSVGDIASTTYVGVDAVKFVSVSTPATPAAPSDLSAVAASATSVNLAWMDNSSNETGFTVQRKLSTEADTAWKAVKTLAADTKTFTDTGLTAGKTYNYRMYASNASGNSGYSNVVTIKPVVNSTPTATAQNLKTSEDKALSITLGGSDLDKDMLTYAIATQPTNGTLSVLNKNKLTYTPKLNFFGADSFTFKVNDGKVDSASATVSIAIAAVNDLPIANTLAVIVNQETRSSITLQGTDVEDAADKLTFAITKQPTKGKLEAIVGNKVVYTPNKGYKGKDSFTFKVTDTSKGVSVPAAVSIEVKAAAATPTITTIAPLTGKVGQTATINVSGSNLPSTIVASITAQKVDCTRTKVTATAATFTCSLDAAGNQTLSIKTNTQANDGVAITGGTATFTVASVLAAPTNFKAIPSDSKVTVSWDAVTGAVGYSLCHATETITNINNCTTYANGDWWESILTTSVELTTLPNGQPLNNGTAYYFRVIAQDVNGNNSPASLEVTATPNVSDGIINASPNVGKAPLPVTFTYNFPSGASCSIDFGDGQSNNLSSCSGQISHTYTDSWTRRVQLNADGKIVGKTTIRMETNGWIGFVGSLNNYIEPNENICDIQKDGRLYLSPSLSNEGYYWTNFRYLTDMKASGDDAVLEIRIKNPYWEGGISCYDPCIHLVGDGATASACFMSEGCTYYSSIGAADTWRIGWNGDNLSALGRDFSDWRTIKLQTQDGKVRAFFEGEKIYEMDYSGKVGSLSGVGFTFKGSGSIDWVRVNKNDGKQIFSDELNIPNTCK